QILNNLMSNAVKFTSTGGIRVTLFRPRADGEPSRGERANDRTLAIAVNDTGVGIPRDKQQMIFEAFRQADGSMSRRYGGTGLGLSISTELARLLGAEIALTSEPGRGSTFTLYLPAQAPASHPAQPDRASKETAPSSRERPSPAPAVQAQLFDDDRDDIGDDEPRILIVEDDTRFAKILYKMCREKGFKCLVAASGEDGLDLVNQYGPSAVLLDIELPGMNGWAVLEALKDAPATRHIPVHIISVAPASIEARRKGAIGYLSKPVDSEQLDQVFDKIAGISNARIKNVLVVDDDEAARQHIIELLGNGDIRVDQADSGTAAIAAIRARSYDCVILDLAPGDMSGEALLHALDRDPEVELPPVIVNTAHDLTHDQEAALRERARSIVLKSVKSNERLIDEVSPGQPTDIDK
ncbi:MAG: response regulator, partial [Myxococcota bacterium]